MKKLLQFILEGIVGKESFDIEEEAQDDQVVLKVNSDKDNIGLIIGKGGQTIKAIQNVVKVRARLEGKRSFVTVQEKVN